MSFSVHSPVSVAEGFFGGSGKKSTTAANTAANSTTNGTRAMTTATATTTNHDHNNPSSVQVAIRVRPLLPFENGNKSCIEVYPTEDATTFGHHRNILKSVSSGDSTIATFDNSSRHSGSHNNNNNNNNMLSPSSSINSYNSLQVGEEDDHAKKAYTFDHVFPSTSEQIDVYEKCVTPLVQSCIEGYNATVLAYGQTGSGKTHTILGESTGGIDDEADGTKANEGVIPRALRHIFNELESTKEEMARRHESYDSFCDNDDNGNFVPFEYQVKLKILEIYGEDIRDLLGGSGDDQSSNNSDDIDTSSHTQHSLRPMRRATLKRVDSETSYHSFKSLPVTATTSASNASSKYNQRSSISIRDGKKGEDAEIIGANQFRVTNAEEALRHVRHGLTKRVVGKTAMNAHSSRSHAIFTVILQQTMRKQSLEGSDKIDVEMKTSKIHFVDLSGSERVKRSMTVGKRCVVMNDVCSVDGGN